MKRIAILPALLLAIGCGDGFATVEGTVALDGKSIESGSITFIKIEGEPAREGAVIQSGAFKSRMPPGTYRVELHARKLVSNRKQKGFDGQDEVVDVVQERFPDRFNTRSGLTEKIQVGVNKVVFDLKSP